MIATNQELVQKAINVAKNLPTVYVNGAFGCRFGKDYYNPDYSYNKKHAAELEKYKNTDPITFGFDCVCFIKGLLWDFAGDPNREFGGAKYQSNGVPDITESSMMEACLEPSTDFSKIEVGEFLWMKGHCGLYIGDGLGVECTPKWENKVQITAVGNIGQKDGYNTRTWTKHGKLPYIKYVPDENEPKFCIQLDQDLKRGDKGEKVVDLQTRLAQLTPEFEKELKSHSWKNGAFDGTFGKGTENTIKALQEDLGLEATGQCDSTLRALLNAYALPYIIQVYEIRTILDDKE